MRSPHWTAMRNRRCSPIAHHSPSTPSMSPRTATIRAAYRLMAQLPGSTRPSVLARAVGLDMVQAGWRPTVDNYLGRITKSRILDAVREAKGEASAQLIDHLKSPIWRGKPSASWMARDGCPSRCASPAPKRIRRGKRWRRAPLPEFLAEDEDDSPEDEVQRHTCGGRMSRRRGAAQAHPRPMLSLISRSPASRRASVFLAAAAVHRLWSPAVDESERAAGTV